MMKTLLFLVKTGISVPIFLPRIYIWLINFLLLSGFYTPLSAQISSNSQIDSVITKARSYWGIPHAARSNSGLDCSGLMMRSYASIGIKLERCSRSQVAQGKAVKRDELRKGDLVFFKVRGRIGHVGMVVSELGEAVRFIHTSASAGVKEDTLNKKFWTNCYVTARRILF